MKIVIIILIYLIPLLVTRSWLIKATSENGIFLEKEKRKLGNVFLCITPVINILFMILGFFNSQTYEEPDNKIAKLFFKTKK